MKLRESGMPEEAYWETLFDVESILDRLEIDGALGDVVELGCGYGTFTIPVAQRISGLLRTYDIDPDMIVRTLSRAGDAAIGNIACAERDIFADGFDVPDDSQDACLLFNILHCEEPSRLLTEAARVVRPEGHVLAIHWRYDPATPRGPSLDIRPRPEQIVTWAQSADLDAVAPAVIELPPWHYGIRFRKRTS
jgi:SAM-dependent methyltransferase